MVSSSLSSRAFPMVSLPARLGFEQCRRLGKPSSENGFNWFSGYSPMGETGFVRFPRSLDPRAEEFWHKNPYTPNQMPLDQSQFCYSYPQPYLLPFCSNYGDYLQKERKNRGGG